MYRVNMFVQVFEKNLVMDQLDAVCVGLCEVCCPRASIQEVSINNILHSDIQKQSLATALETECRGILSHRKTVRVVTAVVHAVVEAVEVEPLQIVRHLTTNWSTGTLIIFVPGMVRSYQMVP